MPSWMILAGALLLAVAILLAFLWERHFTERAVVVRKGKTPECFNPFAAGAWGTDDLDDESWLPEEHWLLVERQGKSYFVDVGWNEFGRVKVGDEVNLLWRRKVLTGRIAPLCLTDRK